MIYFLSILAIVIIFLITRYVIKYNQFVKKANQIWTTYRNEILNEIQSIGEKEITSYLCFKLEEIDSEENVINIPIDINNNWKGQTLEINFPKKLDDGASEYVADVKVSTRKIDFTQIGITRFYCIKSPRVKLKNGKYQNLYSATKFIQKSKRLKEIYKDFIGRKKYEALELFLSNPIRLFCSPQWIQTPRYLKCPKCKKNMILVAQIPGLYLTKKSDKIFGHGDIYIFSCNEHVDTFKSVIDIT